MAHYTSCVYFVGRFLLGVVWVYPTTNKFANKSCWNLCNRCFLCTEQVTFIVGNLYREYLLSYLSPVRVSTSVFLNVNLLNFSNKHDWLLHAVLPNIVPTVGTCNTYATYCWQHLLVGLLQQRYCWRGNFLGGFHACKLNQQLKNKKLPRLTCHSLTSAFNCARCKWNSPGCSMSWFSTELAVNSAAGEGTFKLPQTCNVHQMKRSEYT